MASGTNKLNDKKLRSLLNTPREKEIVIADGEGLSVRVSKSGAVSWVYAYRLDGRGARLERLRLGNYPDNVVMETDANANIKPNKKKAANKIDPAVAFLMSFGTYQLQHEEFAFDLSEEQQQRLAAFKGI
ncbi:Arm DNA-binding domain-containing protein [Serratia sp. UGAL515B_01]|uniref:Arm DNA-binding domain-containing protein n=1 Tax=Serratia sp. UGAL515B_01 TaxID=2986763 RepID=UPI002954F1FF|nr:terminase TerL endonuclease subunit [Serratia sp. UGAL515B_01]WON76723.1 terminase large subunit [Serratia sp. UGAL515B_01]